MKGIPNNSVTAQIFDMVSLLDSPCRRRTSTTSVARQSASLLSIRQSLTYQAAIGVEDIASVRNNYSHTVANEVLATLRKLLGAEFGHLRVHRHKQVYVVSHHCLEKLIAGLLRVQFHGKHMDLPAVNNRGELVDNISVAFSWGVGMSVSEAETERQRQYKHKNS